jgi:hypothetical protein
MSTENIVMTVAIVIMVLMFLYISTINSDKL